MDIKRIAAHLFAGPWKVKRAFPKQSMDRIAEAIAESEKMHSGEVVFVVEGTLGLGDLLRGKNHEQRALELFSELRVWDTESNNGVMIYLLLADRRVQVIADRGVRRYVKDDSWQENSRVIERDSSERSFEESVIRGIEKISKHLKEHFPAQLKDGNELPDQPVVV